MPSMFTHTTIRVAQICDRLCCSFGTDILDALFSKSTLVDGEGDGHGGHARRHLRPVTFFLLALGYMRILLMMIGGVGSKWFFGVH